MYLTRDEEKLLEEEGSDVCMRLLITIGKVFNAEKMIKVKSVHISGISYQNIGDVGLEWIEELSKKAKFRVKATVNPSGMDIERWREMGISYEFYEKQMRILKALEKMGAKLEMSCTPYYFERVGFGDNVAWAESNAVIYANSVMGIRTNRESGITAIASAVTGLTPFYGLHIDENRVADLRIKVDIKRNGDAAIAGCLIGKIECNIPYIISKELRESELKAMGAAMAATGGKAMFHVENQTPEWDFYDIPREVVDLNDDIKSMREDVSPTEKPDLIAIGCPHCYVGEILKIAEFAKKGFKIPVWVFTCRRLLKNKVIAEAKEIIEKNGGRVFCDTCMVVSPATERYEKVMVNSGKALTYLPKLRKVSTFFGSLEECMNVAINGKI